MGRFDWSNWLRNPRRVLPVLLALSAALAAVPFIPTVAGADPPANRNFVAVLSGDNEVPARDTRGRGLAKFQLSEDGTQLSYQLISSNIENVFQAHIHLAPPGVNGSIVVWLFPSVAPTPGPFGTGRTDGVLATGTITAANFVDGLSGHPMSDLVSALRNGGAYVNVHTNDGISGTNTGPGDFPGGEIRGQVNAGGQ